MYTSPAFGSIFIQALESGVHVCIDRSRYETSDRSADKFSIVAWDMDKAFTSGRGFHWDVPVCGPNGGTNCAQCGFDPGKYTSTLPLLVVYEF